MPIFTTALTGSTGAGHIAFSGSIETSGFLSGLGVGNAKWMNSPTEVPEDYRSLLYGPIWINHTGSLRIREGAIVKIQDIVDI